MVYLVRLWNETYSDFKQSFQALMFWHSDNLLLYHFIAYSLSGNHYLILNSVYELIM